MYTHINIHIYISYAQENAQKSKANKRQNILECRIFFFDCKNLFPDLVQTFMLGQLKFPTKLSQIAVICS